MSRTDGTAVDVGEPDLGDERTAASFAALAERVRAADTPERPRLTRRQLVAEYHHPPVDSRLRCFIAGGDDPVGYAWLYLPGEENAHFAEVELAVDPRRRREGIGTALLEHVIAAARAEYRTELVVLARTTWQDGPERSVAGPRLLERRGFSAALTEVDRRLLVADLDPDRERVLWQEAEAAAGGDYELVTWSRRTPERYLEPLRRIESMVFEQVPLGDIELRRSEVGVERQRARDERFIAMGVRRLRAIAVHRASGRVAANTALVVFPEAEHAGQGITIVDPADRGHRLGLLVKLANLRALRAELGHVREVWTGNADVNDHMAAINRRLGFAAVDASVSYRLDLRA